MYQCTNCLTVYDEQLGETDKDIAPETAFEDLPVTYTCALCEAQKSDFKKINTELLGLQVL